MGSLFMNEWPTFQSLVFGDSRLSGWLLDIDLVTPDGDNIFSKRNQDYFGSVLGSVMAKAKTGMWVRLCHRQAGQLISFGSYTSLIDPWSRMISYHFLNGTTRSDFFLNTSAHGAGQLWSDVTRLDSYKRYQVPFPIIVAGSRPVGSNLSTATTLEATVYEVRVLILAFAATVSYRPRDYSSGTCVIRSQPFSWNESHLCGDAP